MSLTYVSGDPLLTRAQVLAFGHNAKGRTESGPLETRLLQDFPTAFAAYRKLCRSGRSRPGTMWIWRESKPWLAFMVVRDSSVSATRLRYVQSCAMMLARDYRLEGVQNLAVAPLAVEYDWPPLQEVMAYWLHSSALPAVIYEHYLPGVQAVEDFG